ncbi:MAG TPA: hypothetical protein VEV81_04570, partial [Pyrinomonadaceae bacterium]|nr:hypothetical protein [Pyrinomonadaceae bacterium]
APLSSDPNEPIFKEYGFPGHTGLTHLCGERVYGFKVEITWEAFASPARASEIIAYYRRKLGDAGFTAAGGKGIWRLPATAPRPQRVLEVMPVGADSPSKSCGKSPPAKTQSIIVISKMS